MTSRASGSRRVIHRSGSRMPAAVPRFSGWTITFREEDQPAPTPTSAGAGRRRRHDPFGRRDLLRPLQGDIEEGRAAVDRANIASARAAPPVAGQVHDSFALARRQDDDPEVFIRNHGSGPSRVPSAPSGRRRNPRCLEDVLFTPAPWPFHIGRRRRNRRTGDSGKHVRRCNRGREDGCHPGEPIQ